MPYKQSIERVI